MRDKPAPKEEKGKPEAVNLERDEPISTAARRKASFDEERPGEPQ
ncbi:MAG TPA: hypothetical protein VM370_06360 [Candidatus Thermoplasmatota archaeon]|nr:hypothetical protein [Candidatus Thermoplasmatota archaeon]